MRFLAELGHRVVGCELVDQAAAAFFDEAGVEPARSQSADYDVREAAFGGKGGSVRILTGDALTLATEVTGPIDAVFDRAALIALPTELRAPYVARVLGLLRAGAPILLVTLEHDAGSGPPHSVPEDVVHALYAERADVKLLERRDVAAESPHILQKGATHVHEAAYLVTVR
jgi:thiopurine S-methyltransferase